MDMLWTWGGKFFGYRDGDTLRTHNGVHVGQFISDMIYGSNGKYIGELKNSRLVTKKSNQSLTIDTFTPLPKNDWISRKSYYAGYAMYSGYEDFPSPEDFK